MLSKAEAEEMCVTMWPQKEKMLNSPSIKTGQQLYKFTAKYIIYHAMGCGLLKLCFGQRAHAAKPGTWNLESRDECTVWLCGTMPRFFWHPNLRNLEP